ncbi:pyridoxal 5'-phosphate synthase glutaminase subunit PdxT [Methanoculleus sp. FWC-SCC1]|uniref:Pyridoxal 5'-phosphate synthase subunit PdxT n=1 Tax=Methanoculleus frigidifontis TaxID=2584085 RepID=A0ABT8MA72_9EURY|nr:pyridoxal 5'-phosphate synthase glutaminase subunit PdxT [Methanoculleus sp. FWC-SCC1]MDN7024834.1 pyridoxal 5'-phosphate synthase glutaminase subunit PdxT [Methanoculleus sp. FWC-SCC1]
MAGKIGVLALQGDVSEHIGAFERALGPGAETRVVAVRRAEQIADLDAIALPGGESTTISRLIEKNGMHRLLAEFEGGIFATCAGMVLVASEVDDPRVSPLGILDIGVERNAFGRQAESHEAYLEIAGLDEPFHAIFIRAPLASRVGAGVEVLARTELGVVAVRQGRHMAFSFHPELAGDLRLHRLFLENLSL